jgi:tRNA modification GTPase
VVERAVDLRGLSVCFLDTAGEGGTDDPLEQAGVVLGRELTVDVDLTIVLLPLHQALCSTAMEVLERTGNTARLVVGSHADLPQHPDHPTVDLRLDNRSGTGVDAVRDAVCAQLQGEAGSGARAVALSQRQHGLCVALSAQLSEAEDALTGAAGPAVAAEALVCALESLGDLEGTRAREAILDRLFARFCIGK